VETRFFAELPVVTVLFDAGQLEVLVGGFRTAVTAGSPGALGRLLTWLEKLRDETRAGPNVGVPAHGGGRGEVVRCAGSWVEEPEPRTREERREFREQQKDLARELVSTYRDFRRCPVVSNAPTGLKYRISLDPTLAISVDEAQLRLLSSALRSAIDAMDGPEPASPAAPSRWELRELDVRVREVIACWDEGGCRS
jgi:hypothetical protein